MALKPSIGCHHINARRFKRIFARKYQLPVIVASYNVTHHHTKGMNRARILRKLGHVEGMDFGPNNTSYSSMFQFFFITQFSILRRIRALNVIKKDSTSS